MNRNALPRVAFVSHSPWFAGAERALINLLEHLPLQIIQPIVLFPDTNGPVKEIVKERLGLPTFELPYGFSLPTTNRGGFEMRLDKEAVAFASLYRELEVDAVVVNTTVIYSAAAAAVHTGIPLLVHSHGVIFPRLFPSLDFLAWSKFDSLQLNIADRVLVPSAWVSAYCRRTSHLSESDIGILPNGTEIPHLHNDPGAVAQSDIPEFVMLCTLEPNKGVVNFLEAAAIILAKRPAGAIFTVYGDEASEYRESLFSFIRQHNLENSCFLRPKQADVASIYRRCYAAIVASEVESFSFVTIEAMSYAKPVIATRSGGPEDIVEDGKTGYLISVSDSESLAERMIRLMDDPELSRQMGLAGRKRVESHYDIKKIARDYLDNILDLLKKPRSLDILQRKRLLLSLARLDGLNVESYDTDTACNHSAAQNVLSERPVNASEIAADKQLLLNALWKVKECVREAV